MDYEKKYNDALERAKNLITSDRGILVKKQTLESIFPELAESEDERIKKKILRKMRACQKESNFFDDEEIAWVEKQGEKKLAWSEDDEGYMDRIFDALYDFYPKMYAQSIYDWLESLKKSMKGE